MSGEKRPVVFGATGFTGELVARAAARAGLRPVLAARDGARLEAIAASLDPVPETIIADVRDPASLDAMAARASVVCSTVGPFAELGEPVVRACIAAGAHYLDSSGEQAWLARVYDAFDAPARETGVVVCPSMAFEVAIADCAAAIAASALDRVDRVSVVYALNGFGTSRGTRASALGALSHGGWQWEDGERRREAPAARVREVDLPGVGAGRVVSFPSGEVLTVPRHVEVPEVHTFMRVPRASAPALHALGTVGASIAAGPAGALARRVVDRLPRGPSDEVRTSARATVVAVAHGSSGSAPRARTVSVALTDPYGLTARILVEGATLLATSPCPAGARAPAEVAGDPRAFLAALGLEPVERDGDVGV